jgi:serine/threonine-protein kinase
MDAIRLENYVLDAELGRGDLTIAYQGRRKSDNAVVAIKVVAPQFTFDEYFSRRFLDMAKNAARLDHPNIVRTYEANKEGDILFVVREMVEARPLSEVLAAEGPFSDQQMLLIAKQIAAALDYAHQKSIMHGDLSAHRVYLGPNDHVTVADFGQTQAMAGTSLVKQGYAVGAPEVMAPERVRGQGPSRQSDLYSLGVLCYQMLNGEPPFVGEPAAVLHAQAYELPRPLHVANPDVSPRISEAIGRMLSKGLELRYATGAEFTRALTVAAQGTAPMRVRSISSEFRPEAAPPPPPIWQKPWFMALVGLLLVFILLAVGFAAVSLFWVALKPALSQPLTIAPTPIQAEVAVAPIEDAPPVESANPNQAAANDAVILVEGTIAPEITATPAPTATPSPTPTLVPLPTPGPPVIASDSPFTNLKLAHALVDGQADKVGMSFAPGSQPIYLFFDYRDIPAGANWSHRWRWADTELGVNEETWPDNFSEVGTAWVYYSPSGGFQPGPYQVTLEIDGKTVATATFVVEPGGI